MNKLNNWFWLIAAFILGVLACQIFYSITGTLDDEKIARDIDQLREEHQKTQRELDKVDSLLNLIPETDPGTNE